MKRAEAQIIGAPLFKFDERTNDVNDIDAA